MKTELPLFRLSKEAILKGPTQKAEQWVTLQNLRVTLELLKET
jgi:hypothetical protein